MPSSTITVKSTHDAKPGKKNATVVATDDTLWLVEPGMKNLFVPGATYDVSYESFDFRGNTFRNIKTCKQVGAAASPPAATGTGGAATGAAYDSAKSEQIAVLALVKGWMDKITVGDTETLLHAIRSCRDAWKKAYSTPMPTKVESGKKDEMEDEIPEFR